MTVTAKPEQPEKVAVVTGAGSGIGKAAALALLSAGFRVVFSGRKLERLERAIAEAAPQLRERALPWVADVREPTSVAALFEATLQQLGRLDFLFNNAGIGAPPVALEALDYAHWRASLDTNLTGAFLCTQHAFRIMKAQTPRGGRILNNGSISAHVPRPNSVAYTASKHGMTGLTRAAGLDGRAFDIAVGQIDIGNASTPLTERMDQGVPQADGSVRVEPRIDVSLVAEAVVQIAGLPLAANVPFMTLMATQMPYQGRG
jgi:NAD(P)-dependent dehydrogenase (short-subunit alcohol dehydrogenase family)